MDQGTSRQVPDAGSQGLVQTMSEVPPLQAGVSAVVLRRQSHCSVSYPLRSDAIV